MRTCHVFCTTSPKRFHLAAILAPTRHKSTPHPEISTTDSFLRTLSQSAHIPTTPAEAEQPNNPPQRHFQPPSPPPSPPPLVEEEAASGHPAAVAEAQSHSTVGAEGVLLLRAAHRSRLLALDLDLDRPVEGNPDLLLLGLVVAAAACSTGLGSGVSRRTTIGVSGKWEGAHSRRSIVDSLRTRRRGLGHRSGRSTERLVRRIPVLLRLRLR